MSFLNFVKSKRTVGAESVQGAMSKEETSSTRFRFILDFTASGVECREELWQHTVCGTRCLGDTDPREHGGLFAFSAGQDEGLNVLGCRVDILGTNCNKLKIID